MSVSSRFVVARFFGIDELKGRVAAGFVTRHREDVWARVVEAERMVR